MWMLRLKGGLELTEAQAGYWDNVPLNAEIEALALTIPRDGAAPYVIEFRGYEEYVCAKQAAGGMGGLVAMGYCVYAVRQGQVTEIEILPAGMRLKIYPREKSDVPDRCWRRGTD